MNIPILYPEFNGCCMCLENQYLCNNKKCIPINWKCNGNNDCGDNSDEHAQAGCEGNNVDIWLFSSCSNFRLIINYF